MSNPKPIALDAYEQLADAYAAKVDTKPHNAYYERPATLSLLPDVSGCNVLDAGCGPGAYSEWLVRHGAHVVAVDASPRMIEHARQRVGPAASFHVADLQAGLPFLSAGFFDLVLAPLVMDCIPDWLSLFRRFDELLKPGGLLVFSTGHPSFEAAYYKTENYFATEQVRTVWKGFGPIVEVPSFRRPLSAVLNPLIGAGFELMEVREPVPTEAFQKADPVKYEKLLRHPAFLCIKARKHSAADVR